MLQLVYGAVVVNPISFPDELEIQVCPAARKDNTIHGSMTIVPHRSWDWIRQHYPIRPESLLVAEGSLKDGKPFNLPPAEVWVNLPDGVNWPNRLDFAEREGSW